MSKKIISMFHSMKGGVLDNDYTLFEDGTVLHEYDRHAYPGGQDIKETMTVDDLSDSIKQRLYDAAKDDNKELVHKILKLDSES
jgi:hypothetical protein